MISTPPLVKNGLYLLAVLQPGDRFYFCNDRKKIVYTVKSHARVKQKGFTKKYCIAVKDPIIQGTTTEKKEIQQRFEDSRHVIYLRSIEVTA